MARNNATFIRNGEGKVGQVVLTSWKGKDVLKAHQPNVNQPNTLPQQKQKVKIGLLSKLSRFTKTAVVLGFKEACGNAMTEYNKFVSLNSPWIEVDDDLLPALNFDKFHFSSGNLLSLRNGSTLGLVGNTLTVTFIADNQTTASSSDKLCIVVLSSTLDSAYVYFGSERRADTTATLELPTHVMPTYHVYGFYYDLTGAVSETTYIGTV